MDRLIAAVKARALEAPAGQGARWAELWTRLAELPDRTAAINLDRADVLAGALADIARTKALGCSSTVTSICTPLSSTRIGTP